MQKNERPIVKEKELVEVPPDAWMEKEVTTLTFDPSREKELDDPVIPKGFDAKLFKNDEWFNQLRIELKAPIVLDGYALRSLVIKDISAFGLILSHSDGLANILIPWGSIKHISQDVLI